VPPRKLGMKIKRRREELDMTQADLAARVGISRVHLANIESADTAKHHRSPSLATLEKIAKALKSKVTELLG
jgi:transcriptional regulator with XRE-family HTH domain